MTSNDMLQCVGWVGWPPNIFAFSLCSREFSGERKRRPNATRPPGLEINALADIILQHQEARIRLDTARREYLNRLVKASALDGDNQVRESESSTPVYFRRASTSTHITFFLCG